MGFLSLSGSGIFVSDRVFSSLRKEKSLGVSVPA